MTKPSETPPPELKTTPVSPYDDTLLRRFAEDASEQAGRMDQLARQLITLDIAIPGLYAAVLKFVSGQESAPQPRAVLLLMFLAWLLALGLAFISLYPNHYRVEPDNPNDIERYFFQSARHKLIWLLASGFCSFFGISLAVFSLFP